MSQMILTSSLFRLYSVSEALIHLILSTHMKILSSTHFDNTMASGNCAMIKLESLSPSNPYCLSKRGETMAKADNMLAILKIHVRTVYRCIDALCASGVPIVAETGRDGGYSIPVGFCHLRGEIRSFREDRIGRIRQTGSPFNALRRFPPGNICSAACFRSRRMQTINGSSCGSPVRPRHWTTCAPIGCSVTRSSNGHRTRRCFNWTSIPCLRTPPTICCPSAAKSGCSIRRS